MKQVSPLEGIRPRTANLKARILIVDDHPIVREGMKHTINKELDLAVCGEAESISETLPAVGRLRPNLVLLDLSLRGILCLELIKDIKGHYPLLLIMVVSVHDEFLVAEHALQAGAQGYINKQAAVSELVEAVRFVLNGGVYLSEAMRFRLASKCTHRGAPSSMSPMDLLSDRELEVFHLIGKGRGVRQIAVALHLDINTVKTYRMRIKVKLNLSSSTEVLQHAVRWGEGDRLPVTQERVR